MTVYVLRDGELVEKTKAPPLKTAVPLPYFMSDTPDYFSIASGKMISGRAARREDLKRTGCREVDPSEAPKGYINPKYERRYSKDARKLARSR